jgi:UDP-glucuronate 4-epimerase
MNNHKNLDNILNNGDHILITGSAGFIGFHLSQYLLSRGYKVIGIDNLNDYYDVNLKNDRLIQLKKYQNFRFYKLNLEDRQGLEKLFEDQTFNIVVNLAAQPGVRYSIKHPHAYIDSNLVGFMNVLEGCRQSKVGHLVCASSSSVYGANTKTPFSVHDNVDHPISLYAATKKANELMAHSYSHLYGIPITCLRFFTVYGSWGRPDMAPMLFTKAILSKKPIDVFNYGKMQRDFTYIDDIVEGVFQVIHTIPQSNPNWTGSLPDPATSQAPYRIYNIGNNKPIELMYFIELLENCLGIKAEKNMLPMQAGDVLTTYADIEDLVRDVGFKPTTPIEVGIEHFVSWYRSYYKI